MRSLHTWLGRTHKSENEVFDLFVAQELEGSREDSLENELVSAFAENAIKATYLHHLHVHASIPSKNTVFAVHLNQNVEGIRIGFRVLQLSVSFLFGSHVAKTRLKDE